MISDCTAIILAGGSSQRMGRDKARLIFDGQPLLHGVVATMTTLFADVALCVRQARSDIDIPQFCDDPAYAGPLAGLLGGMDRITTPWAFLIACDMPFVAVKLVELLALRRGNFQAVVPLAHEYPQPLAAFYARSSLVDIRAHLASGGKPSMRAVLEKLQVCYVHDAELRSADPLLRSFVDLDTPEDFAREVSDGGCGI